MQAVPASPKTQIFYDNPKTVVNRVNSPDLGTYYSLNPYQGCEHGCAYCYARSTHEYWGFSAGLDFESKIIVKRGVVDLLRKSFEKPGWRVLPIFLSGNTDCYQPIERQFQITRSVLQLCLEYNHPVSILTKNTLVARDQDLLEMLAKKNLVNVGFSITTFDEKLRRSLEPRTASAAMKIKLIEKFSKAGIPVFIMVAPIIPGLNDHEIPSILQKVSRAGALEASYTVVRLNGPLGELFEDWIDKNYPDKKKKILEGIRALHGGSLHDAKWGRRIRGEGPRAVVIRQLFAIAKKNWFAGRLAPLDCSKMKPATVGRKAGPESRAQTARAGEFRYY